METILLHIFMVGETTDDIKDKMNESKQKKVESY